MRKEHTFLRKAQHQPLKKRKMKLAGSEVVRYRVFGQAEPRQLNRSRIAQGNCAKGPRASLALHSRPRPMRAARPFDVDA